MTRRVWLALLLWLGLLFMGLFAPTLASAQDLIAHGRFDQVHLYKPSGQPRQFVLFLSGANGWTDTEAALAERLVKRGAMVAGIDTPGLAAKLGPNELPIGDLENLAHYLQGYARLTTYLTPLMATAPATETFARNLTAAAPPGLFAGVFVADDTPGLITTYDILAAGNRAALPPPPPSLKGLPLIEVPATASTSAAPTLTRQDALQDTFAIFLSGDGGWAGLDQNVAKALAAQGVPVVGLDSLRYFWRKRTPDGLAADLDRIQRYYAAHWSRSRVVLIGYSQGANVLPAAYNRLTETQRAPVAQVVLIGLEDRVTWQFHLSGWMGSAPADADPTAPEAAKLTAATALCLYGEGDANALCDKLPPESVTAQQLPGGHHFNGDFDGLAARILDRLK